MEFQSRRPPRIRNDELPEIQKLLALFDYITFNMDAELLAVIEGSMPIIGPVIISYFVREDHIQVMRKGDDDNPYKPIVSDYLCIGLGRDEEDAPPVTKAMLLKRVNEMVAEKIREAFPL